jgi:hypothetical protein
MRQPVTGLPEPTPIRVTQAWSGSARDDSTFLPVALLNERGGSQPPQDRGGYKSLRQPQGCKAEGSNPLADSLDLDEGIGLDGSVQLIGRLGICASPLGYTARMRRRRQTRRELFTLGLWGLALGLALAIAAAILLT